MTDLWRGEGGGAGSPEGQALMRELMERESRLADPWESLDVGARNGFAATPALMFGSSRFAWNAIDRELARVHHEKNGTELPAGVGESHDTLAARFCNIMGLISFEELAAIRLSAETDDC